MIRLFLALFILSVRLSAEIVAAPIAPQIPANQLRVFDNSCGPTTLYNSFLYGTEPWRDIVESIDKDSPREKVRSIVRTYGARPSASRNGARRWNGRKGINSQDLAIIANEMRGERRLHAIDLTTYFQGKRERNDVVLKRLYKDLRTSLKRGFPPIATLQRYRTQTTRRGQVMWNLAQSHFVTIVAIPDKLPKKSLSFRVTYIDPWGGKILTGDVRAPLQIYPAAAKDGAAFNPLLPPATPVADFPKTRVGLSDVPKGESSLLILGGLIAAQ